VHHKHSPQIETKAHYTSHANAVKASYIFKHKQKIK